MSASAIGTLEQLLRRNVQRLIRGQVGIEGFERLVETLDSCVPCERRRIVPRRFSLRHRERPVQQIADMRQQLAGRSGFFRSLKFGEVGWRAAHGFCAAIGQRRNGVAQHLTLRDCYSYRKACVGSTREARRAGTTLARNAISPKSNTTAPIVKGSEPLTPASNRPVIRATEKAIPTPMANPMLTQSNDRCNTRRSTCERGAPKRHADSDFARPPRHREVQHAIDSDRRQQRAP